MSVLYADSRLPVPAGIEQVHREALESFTRPGRWLSGAQRAEIVAEARDARTEAGLHTSAAHGLEAGAGRSLSETARAVTRQVAVRTNDLDRSFAEAALAGGMSDGEYVETIGVVARALNMDVFARGIGVGPRELPPVQPGEPSRARPVNALDEGAWVHTVPGGGRGGDEAVEIYGTRRPEGAPFIFRSLSLAPQEAQALIATNGAQYVDMPQFMDFGLMFESGLTRADVETVAGRISALNDCFY